MKKYKKNKSTPSCMPTACFKSLIFNLLMTSSRAKTYKEYGDFTPCLSTIYDPRHGTFTFSGQFILNIVCPAPDTDIPANTPGKPPGILYCDPHRNEINKEIGNLKLPQCIPSPAMDNPLIKMDIAFLYRIPGQDCSSIDWVNELVISRFVDTIHPYVKTFCPDCATTNPENAPCSVFDSTAIAEEKVGIVKPYDKKKNLTVYQELWEDIRSLINQNKKVFNVQSSRSESVDVSRIEVTPWRASCDSIPNSMPTILPLHGVVRCRGCSDSHYLDPYRMDRCLQCPFGYWTRRVRADVDKNGYNSVSNCVRCPHPSAVYREEYLRLCFNRN